MSETGGAEAYDHHRGTAPLLRPVGHLRFWGFLTINLCGFVAANAFWQYLSTGQWLRLSPSAWYRDLTAPLGESLLHPLDIFTHPWMMLVMGLLLGVLLFVPAVLAVLHRLEVAAAFVLIVAVVAHAPVLAGVQALGCLAVRTRLRSNMPFLAALLGLLPAGAYLFLFGFAGMDTSGLLPLQRWILRIPFLLAGVTAVVAAAAVLALARATKFRPGVVWPVLAVLGAAPVLLFYLCVGASRLPYVRLVAPASFGRDLFEPLPLEEWRRRNAAEGLAETVLLTRLQDDLEQRQRALADRCRAFLRAYPESPQAPGVLWLAAQAADLQFDRPAFETGFVRYTSEFPRDGTAPLWQRLIDECSSAPQAHLARWRLAVLALRAREPRRALGLLQDAEEGLQQTLARWRDGRAGDFFRPPAPLPGREVYEDALSQTRQLLWLLERKKHLADERSAEALAALLQVNRHAATDAEYYQELARLAGRFEGTRLAANLKLAVALATRDLSERVLQLVPLARQWGEDDADAAIQANYELGLVLLRNPELRQIPEVKSPGEYFKIVRAASASPWKGPAEERLLWLQATTTRAASSPDEKPREAP